MKKSSIVLAVTAALALAYPATSYLSGKRLETKLTQTDDASSMFPTLKVVKQHYQRGFFSSIQESTYEFSLPNSEKVVPMSLAEDEQAEQGTAVAPDEATEQALPLSPKVLAKPLQFTVINHIQHGPIPGIVGIGAGKIDTEIVLPEEARAEIKKIFGDKKFLNIRTILNYAGGGTIYADSPAVTSLIGNSQDKLNWKGIKVEASFDEGYNKLSYLVQTDGLQVEAKDPKNAALLHKVNIGKIKFSGSNQRAYPKSYVFLGDVAFSIDAINYSNSAQADSGFSLKNLLISSDSKIKNDLVDMGIKMGIEQIQAKQKDIGAFHYDYSLKRLHAPSLHKFYETLSKINGNMEAPEHILTLQKSLKQLGMEILKHDPVLSLDRLSLTGKNGEVKASADVKIVNFQPEDLENPMLLVPKLESKGQINIAEALVQDLIENTQTDPNARSMAMSMFNMQLANLETQGYVKRDGKNLQSQLLWSKGKLSINGKPYPPTAVATDSGAVGTQAK
ncbi:MAG: YdgA family protein [Burkholderiales bacterium]|nr:YdgA family protein [Burkholderiales bacterium]